MVLMNFLRALAELGFYYAAAGMLSAYLGAQLLLEPLLLQSACFALSFALRQSRAARMAALLPALLPVSLAFAAGFFHPVDGLVCLPPVLYLAYLAWTDRYSLSWERQAGLFKISIRVFGALACLFAVLKFRLLSVGIPVMLLSALASVLLMRSLRHDEDVYLQPRYQLMNSIGVVLLTLAALALGSEWSMRAAQYLASAFYNEVLIPLISLTGTAIGIFFLWIPRLLRRLFHPDDVFEEPLFGAPLDEDGERLLDEEGEMLSELSGSSPVLQIFLAVVVVAVIVLVFRWLLRRWEDGGRPPEVTRTDLPRDRAGKQAAGSWARTYAGRIRRQYRSFLQLCLRRGVRIRPSDTSTEIGEKSLPKFQDEPSLSAMRDIYQEARYDGKASRADYQEFKRLMGVLKKLPD